MRTYQPYSPGPDWNMVLCEWIRRKRSHGLKQASQDILSTIPRRYHSAFKRKIAHFNPRMSNNVRREMIMRWFALDNQFRLSMRPNMPQSLVHAITQWRNKERYKITIETQNAAEDEWIINNPPIPSARCDGTIAN